MAFVDLNGEATHVFDQHDPQRDRHRPKLTDGERLHALVGAHEPAERLRVEETVGVSDIGPGESEHARIARERAIGQLRQLPVIAGWHVVTDLADLRLDDVVVVDEPFRRRHDRAHLSSCG